MKIILVLAMGLALAACTSANRFDNPNDSLTANPELSAPPTELDPTSVAYFSDEIGDRVLFPVDQSTLTEEARAILIQQAQWLNANLQYTAVIEGHADERNTTAYNLALSNRRASAVKQYLVSQGVAPTRLREIGYGKERPLAICSDESCYAQNRRAVTVLSAIGTI